MKKRFENSPTILLSSRLSRVRGFTIDILYHLKNRMITASELAEITGKYRQYVNKYLYRMRKYGIIEKQGPFWKITEEGLSYLLHLEEVSKYSKYRRQKEDRKKTLRRQKEDISIQKKPKQVSIQLFLQDLSLSDAERRIIEVLYRHYVKTGSLFVFFPVDIYQDPYEPAKFFKIKPDQVVPAFRRLKQDRLAYKILDRKYGACKVALYKSFAATLELEATIQEKEKANGKKK